MTDWPQAAPPLADETTDVVVLAAVTFCTKAGEVLVAKSVVALTTAVIEWLATDRVEVVQVAVPPLTGFVPSKTAPS